MLADAPGLDGDEAVFVALPDGSLLVEEGPDGELAPLAAAVEQEVRAAVPGPRRPSGRVALGGAGDADRGARARGRPAGRRDRPDPRRRRRSSCASTASAPSARSARSRSAAPARDATSPSTPSGSRTTSGRSGPRLSDARSTRWRTASPPTTPSAATLGACPSSSAPSRRSCASARAGGSSGSPTRRPTSARSSPSSRSSPTPSCAAKTAEFRQRVENGESLDDVLFEAYAAVREAFKRTIGRSASSTSS